MIDAPSSTWFTTPPHWGWLIVLYFFIGGLAGGCYFLAVLIDLLGRPEDRPLARLGYFIAFPCLVLSGLLLTIDLGRPLRFWHMLIERNTGAPMFKYWSPMSIGSWALLIFGIFSFLSFLGAAAEENRIRMPALRALRPPAPLGTVVGVLGALGGLYLASYTGVLLAVTNRPIWSDTALLSLLFLISAASSSAALMILLGHRLYGWTMRGLVNLHRFDDWVIVMELVTLIAVMISLGPVFRAWMNGWGVLLLAVIVLGLIVPLVLSLRTPRMRELNVGMIAGLVLFGSFLLRVVIVFSSEAT